MTGRILLAAVAMSIALPTAQAAAISRYNGASMSCSDIRSTVRRDGAAIVRFRSSQGTELTRYGRFVRDNRYCASGERAETSFIPAADRKSCPVLECKYYSPDDDFIILDR